MAVNPYQAYYPPAAYAQGGGGGAAGGGGQGLGYYGGQGGGGGGQGHQGGGGGGGGGGAAGGGGIIPHPRPRYAANQWIYFRRRDNGNIRLGQITSVASHSSIIQAAAKNRVEYMVTEYAIQDGAVGDSYKIEEPRVIQRAPVPGWYVNQ